ncbi:phosphonate C-P lyase system protein PhnG [Blastochloris tepida]|uniref:Phosphonate C-P lyase system protein PhnG n=1 Tax=Blastochloris tepida TaxID=2233851 RepID=A0A348G0G8_9HYPH|nr:phosphonate C-P lyase system protein PhnG [Blastochloris tepida]BBF93051.1 phosphonate C-P lyase system protein PhnG [Blastochloris tepida]
MTRDETADRRAAMALLAAAEAGELEAAWAAWPGKPAVADLRKAACGLVMVRGRIGGDGAPFNLGEATVTRAAVRLASGHVGHAYLLGRAPERARLAAIFDALWQDAATRPRVEAELLVPVRARLAAQATKAAAEAAATRVEFFTVTRGDNQEAAS